MLLTFIACDEETAVIDDENTENDENSGENGENDGNHTHTYSSSVTKEVSCTENGVNTFMCTCGDTYTEEITSPGHKFGSWFTETYAIVGKDGVEKRVCSVCETPETRTTTKDAAARSFTDDDLEFFFMYGGSPIMTGNLITTYAIHEYVRNIYRRADFEKDVFEIPASEYLATAQKHFVLDDTQLAALNPTGEDTITFYYDNPIGFTHEVAGYVHNSGNTYTVYYTSFSYPNFGSAFAVEIEYNLPSGEPNRYISIIEIDALPDNMIGIN